MERTNSSKSVLVTGGADFIAVHCILKLLQQGYNVRATLRSLNRQGEVKDMLRVGGVTQFENLSFIEANLSDDRNWNEAVKGCDYVLHVASPTPIIKYSHEDEFIKPAKDGVLRVLKAARDAGVKRVVLTSAFGAIGMGHKSRTTPYTENDWTNITANIHPYQKSKTIAEQTAWDFIKNEGGNMELSTVNPVAVMGPVLGDLSTIKDKLTELPVTYSLSTFHYKLKSSNDYDLDIPIPIMGRWHWDKKNEIFVYNDFLVKGLRDETFFVFRILYTFE